MHKFELKYLNLMLVILPVVCSLLPSRFFRTLPKTDLPADQLAPSPRISTDILALHAQNPQQTPVHYVNSTPSFTLPIPRSPKFIPNSPNIILLPNSFPPLIPPSPTSLHLLPYLISYPIIKYLIPFIKYLIPLFKYLIPFIKCFHFRERNLN